MNANCQAGGWIQKADLLISQQIQQSMRRYLFC
jgi:hypothetical protein